MQQDMHKNSAQALDLYTTGSSEINKEEENDAV